MGIKLPLLSPTEAHTDISVAWLSKFFKEHITFQKRGLLLLSLHFVIIHFHIYSNSVEAKRNERKSPWMQHWYYQMVYLIHSPWPTHSFEQLRALVWHFAFESFIRMHSLSHKIVIQINSIPLSLKYLFCTYYTSGTVWGARDKYPRHGPWIPLNSLICR